MADFNVDELTTGIRQRLSESPGFGSTIKFVFDEGGTIFLNGKMTPTNVSNDDLPANLTLRMSLITLNKLQRKEIDGMMAAMTGKIKLEGDIMLAMQLSQILG